MADVVELAHMEQRDKDVGCWRRCKRRVRRSIKWSQLPMRVQMRIHLILLFGAFFVCYLVFLFLYTGLFYAEKIRQEASLQFEDVLDSRLDQSAQALSTVAYQSDKLAVESLLRLTDVFSRVFNEVQAGYYLQGDHGLQNF